MSKIRFWIWLNSGPVRITLRRGEYLNWARYEPTDEGWSTTYRTYHLPETTDEDNDRVLMDVEYQAQDCDGRIDRYSEYYCLIPDLQEATDEDPVKWQYLDSEQRDREAERAGY